MTALLLWQRLQDASRNLPAKLPENYVQVQLG